MNEYPTIKEMAETLVEIRELNKIIASLPSLPMIEVECPECEWNRTDCICKGTGKITQQAPIEECEFVLKGEK